VEFVAEDFIVDEEVTVVLSRDGWLKRVREVKDISTTRLREGDAVLAALRGSTKELVGIFSNLGSCYVLRIHDVPASTGYGEPVQKLFNFRDGERVIAAYVMTGNGPAVLPMGGQIIAVTKHGFGFRLGPDAHREISTRAGRRYAKLSEGDEVVGVLPFKSKEVLAVVTAKTHTLMCMADEAAELANPGKGVTIIKVADDDDVMGFGLGDRYGDEIFVVELDNGKKVAVGPGHDEVVSRGGRGHALSRKGKVVRVTYPEPAQDPKLVN
jgi:DNA gyrase subunit A